MTRSLHLDENARENIFDEVTFKLRHELMRVGMGGGREVLAKGNVQRLWGKYYPGGRIMCQVMQLK